MTDTGSTTRSIVVNGEQRSVEAETLRDLVVELDLDPRAVAVEHNGEVVRRARHGDTSIQEGDRVEIVRFVQGGSGRPSRDGHDPGPGRDSRSRGGAARS